MSSISKILFSITFMFALAAIDQAAMAQDAAAIPGIKPAVVATEMGEDELMKKASLIMVYEQMSRMKQGLASNGIDLDPEQALEGARKALAGEPLGVDADEAGVVMEQLRKKAMALQKKRQEEMMAKVKAMAAENEKEGETYLAENAKKDGVKVLDGGVQYEVMVEGTGPKPQPTDKVKINYHGMLIDGTVFDSTVDPPAGKEAKPYVNSASAFVPGFNTAIQAMPVGSKWKISIPGESGYGLRGPGPIGPNKTLIFEVELLEIVE